MPPSDWTRRLLTGLAEHLAANDIGVWRPGGVYAAAETGIVLTSLPSSPDRVIALSYYDVATYPGRSDVIGAVQIRARGSRDPLDVSDLHDQVHDLLHSAEDLVLGDIPIALMWRNSYLPLGPDSNGRHEATGNYYLRAARPSRSRRD